MANPHTVFVIGAGAGVSLGFPTGEGLTDQIAALLQFRWDRFGTQIDHDPIEEEIRRAWRADANKLFRTGPRISASIHDFLSIDEFLHSRREDETLVHCGKAAIASAIRRAEAGSFLAQLGEQSDDPYRQLRKSWLGKLFRHLTSSISNKTEALFDRVGFITFNYDRSLRHGLLHLTQRAYELAHKDAAELVAALPVIHIYGSLGALPWQENAGPALSFGGGGDLRTISQRINTYKEGVIDQPDIERARELIRDAERVVFLGFGFHQQNMEILRVSRSARQCHHAVATAYGVSPAHQLVFQDRIEGAIAAPLAKVQVVDATCERLIDDWGMAIVPAR